MITSKKRKMIVIGLDSASPRLIFDKFKKDLPILSKLVENSLYGNLKSCFPPITIPAWMVMFTGKNSGNLGLYGFRHRKNHSYTDIWIANSRSVMEPKVWDTLGKKGRKSCIFGVPPSYPPPPVYGCAVSCFLTPNIKKNYTFPPELKEELEKEIEPYIPDLEMRQGDPKHIRDKLFQMLETNMKIIKYLIREKAWEFFAFVEIGLDRAHHAFWRFFDETHPNYTANTEFTNVILDYYKAVDNHIGEIIELIDENTYVLIASDHGVKPMRGAICINEWLLKEKYLVLKEKPEKPIQLSKAEVDWQKTKAWAWGGYYSRVFLNVKGREKKGLIDQKNYETELNKLRKKLSDIRDENGQKLNNLVINPKEYFDVLKGDYPDLMVIYDDLNWRADGKIGRNSLYLYENETASGDAMHDWNGMFILHDPQKRLPTGRMDINIEDIAPTILYLLGEQLPKNIDGKVISHVKKA